MPQDFFTASSTRTKQPPMPESKVRPMVDEWTMYDYLNKYEKYAENKLYPEERAEFAKIWSESGKPHIIPETNQENLDYNIKWGYDPEITDSDDKYQKTWRTTAHMRYGENHYDPDTLFIPDSPWKSRDFDSEDMLNKLIAELAHSYHKKHTKLVPDKKRKKAFFGLNLLGKSKPLKYIDYNEPASEQEQYDAYAEKSGEDWENYGYDEYDVEGAIEHDVHELIEPSLWDRIYEVQDKADRYSF
tara:strand:+ start:1143 stop:1874 length:732 start_codon:yes stop_codon:yes gene_type:complete